MGKEYLKSCIICKKNFDTGSKHQNVKTCSKECYRKYRKSIEEEVIKKRQATWTEKFGSREKLCITCNKQFNTGKHKEKINCSPGCLKIYQEKHKEERIQKGKEGMLKKHGVDHPSKLPDFSNKVKQTKLEHFGDKNYTNREQAIKTNLEKYGVDNVMKIEATKEKSKKTKKEKYGDENFNNKEQAKRTIVEKYGVKHHLQLPEFIEKMEQTNMERYGEKYTITTKESKDKLKDYNNEKYGCDFFFSSTGYIEKTKKEKIKKIEELLSKNNFKFDINQYTKTKSKDSDGNLYNKKYKIECLKCNNVFEAVLRSTAPICRICHPPTESKFQINFEEFIDSINVSYEINSRKIIKPLEIDIFMPNYNLAVEINGNYFHAESSKGRNKNYHINKTELCNKKNIKLIHIMEHEWRNKKESIKTYIKHLLNIDNYNITDNFQIKKINDKEKEVFLNENSINGNIKSSKNIGLIFNNELVYLTCFRQYKNNWQILRHCSKNNHIIQNGLELTLNHFKSQYNWNSIIVYLDCRWEGVNCKNNTFYQNGFHFIKQTSPSYIYVDKKDYFTTYSRFEIYKQSLLKEFGGDKSKTEWELAQEAGFDRIWDCGSLKFELVNPNFIQKDFLLESNNQ